MELIGCDGDFLIRHLRSTDPALFDSGRKFHVDHILPCNKFDLTLPEMQRACFHWSNLQILTPEENSKKRDKVPITYMETWEGCWAYPLIFG